MIAVPGMGGGSLGDLDEDGGRPVDLDEDPAGDLEEGRLVDEVILGVAIVVISFSSSSLEVVVVGVPLDLVVGVTTRALAFLLPLLPELPRLPVLPLLVVDQVDLGLGGEDRTGESITVSSSSGSTWV